MQKIFFLFFIFLCSLFSFAQPGALDFSFDPDIGTDTVIVVAKVQADGKILIGGYFTSYNGISANGIARLNTDGSLDASFQIGSGFNDVVKYILIQPDGKILVGGWFTEYQGIVAMRMIRLNSDGSVDITFNVGLRDSVTM